MQPITDHRYCDRSSWPSGPWDEEPDAASWVSVAGLPCEMRRNVRGEWWGYVGASPEHSVWTYAGCRLEVHGGVNDLGGSERFDWDPPFPPGLRWLGFDCGHVDDLAPRERDLQFSSRKPAYRDLPYVRAECESLARQIDAVALLAEAGYGGPRHLRGEAWSAPVWAVEIARRFEVPRAVRLQALRCLARDPSAGQRVWKDGIGYSSTEELFAKEQPKKPDTSTKETRDPGEEWMGLAKDILNDTPNVMTHEEWRFEIACALREQYDHGRAKGWRDAINHLQEKDYG